MAQDNLTAYAQWLVQNKDKKGTPEFDKVARAFQMLQAAGPRQAQAPAAPQYDSFGDLVKQRGQQFAQGATEAFASIPEAAAIAGAGNPNAGANVVSETVQKAQADLAALEKDYAERVAAYQEANREVPAELNQRYQEEQFRLREMIGGAVPGRGVGPKGLPSNEAYLRAVTQGGEVNLKPDAQDRDLFKAGDALRKSSEEVFGAPQPNDQSFWGQVAQGGGTVAGMIAQGPFGVGAGAGMNSSQLYKEAKLAGATEEDAKRAAEFGAWVGTTEIIPITRALKLLPPRLRKEVGSKFWKKVSDIAQSSGEEAAQEYAQTVANNLIAQNIYDPERGWNEGAAESALVGAVIGGGVGTIGAVANNSLYTDEGNLKDPETLDDTQRQAAGDLARTFKAITDANPDFNLKDVDKTSAKGARAVVDQAHIQLTEALKQRFADMKSRVKPNQTDTFESVSEKILATAAYREGRNKTKSIVGNQELDALKRLAGDTREGQEAVNLILQLNQLTELHNSGYQGGLSSFTDQFSVFGSKVGYDKGAVATERLLRPLLTGGAALQTGGLSLIGQAAASQGGRAIDKLTGNYSQIDKFVRRNAETPGLQQPTAPSLRDAAAAQLQADEDAKLREEALRTAREAEQRQLNLQLVQEGAPATPGSPQYTLEDATGLSRDGVARILRILKAQNKNPALTRAIADYEQSVATGGIVEDKMLSPLIRAVRQFQQDNPDYVPMVRPPNSLSNPVLAAPAAPGQAPNVNTTEANPVQAQTFGPQLTTPENYNRGIEANKAMNAELVEGVTTDPELNRVQKGRLITSLDVLANNLGSDPVAATQEQVQKLQDAGVPQEAIDTYVKPYVDRVVRQQSRPTSAAPGLQAAQEAGVAPTTETQAPVEPEAQPEAPAQPTDNYTQAVDLVMDEQKVSASFVQRRLGIGYNEAQDIVQRMEDEGLISKPNHVGARKILRQVPPRMAMAPQEDVPQGRLGMDFKDVTKRIPELQEGQRKLQANEITREDYEELVNKYKPVVPYETTPQPETTEDAIYALSNGKGQSEAKAAKFGLPSKELKEGDRVQFRLDIPSYSQHGTWVVSIHRPNSRPDSTAEGRFKAGPVVGYESVGRIKNADLGMLQASAQKIASGSPKGTIATMLGEYVPMTPQEAYQYVNEVLPMTLEPDSGYAQVGMDPERHSYFYDRNTMEPIVSAEDLVQIGPLVVAKNPVYASKADFRYSMPPQKDGDTNKPALQSYVNPFEIPENEIDVTRLNSSPSEADIQKMREGTYKPKQKRTLVEAADYMYQKWKAATGRDEPFEYTPENVDIISTYMATEAANALQSDANAIGWYDRKLKAAKRVVSLVDPRVTKSQDAEAAFDFALAVTSNGQAVADNFQYALEVFRHFMDNGKMPTTTWKKGGERNAAMVEAFDFFNAYQSSGANMPIQDFLDQDFTVNELNDYIARFNEQYGTNIKVPSSEGANADVKGSYIIGPKIGQGFYQNIRGNYDPLTMDIWWMRMWNRLVGRPFEANKDLDKNRARVRKALQTKNQDALEKRLTKETLKDMGITRADLKNNDILDEFVLNLESRYQSFYRQESKRLKGTNQKVPKPELANATGTMKRNLSPQLQATPKGPGERAYMREVTKAAIAKLSDLGYDIETADFQALMWYPEKQLFRHLGVAPGRGADNDYLDAAIMLAESEGITNDQIQEALPDADGDGAFDNQSSPEGVDEGLYRGPSGDGEGQTRAAAAPVTDGVAGILASRLAGGPAQRSSVPSTQEVKQAVEPARAIIEVGKKGSKYEDGIKDINQVRELADAINVTIKMYSDQRQMRMDANAPDSTAAMGLYEGGTAYALDPLAAGSEFQSYITTLHEVAHGLNDQRYSPGDMRTFSPEQQQQLMGTLAGYPPPMTNKLTGRKEQFRRASFDQYIGQMLAGQSGVPKDLQKKILKEMKDLQDRGKYRDGSDVRYIGGTRRPVSERKNTDYYKYIRSTPELAVDPVIYYLHDPKGMKKNYPVTAQAIQQFFRNSSKIQFYSHPLAMAVAVALAMLMKAKREDEQEKQMPPGALNQPIPMGALSQA